MGLRAAASAAADLVGPRPVTEMVPATALDLLAGAGEGVVGMVARVAGEESSASTKEGMRARPNEEGIDSDEDGCGWLWIDGLYAFRCALGIPLARCAWVLGVESPGCGGLRGRERACCALYCGRLELVGERFRGCNGAIEWCTAATGRLWVVTCVLCYKGKCASWVVSS